MLIPPPQSGLQVGDWTPVKLSPATRAVSTGWSSGRPSRCACNPAGSARGKPRPAGKNRGCQTAARRELAAHDTPLRTDGFNNIMKHLVYRIFIENAEIARSEEHTSELQSHVNLVCRLLLEKKN